MKLLRNPELKKELAVMLGVTAVLSVCALMVSSACADFVMIVGILLWGLHVWFAVARYRQMEKMTEEIEAILHGREKLMIHQYNEGELAILADEIEKMTVRLQEQADRLQADKLHLSRAIEDIFHQLRTPLTAMNLSLTALSDQNLPALERVKQLSSVRRQIEHIGWLTETLLSLAKIDAGTAVFHGEDTSVKDLIDRAAESLRIPMELKEIHFIVHADKEHLIADPRWTAEALANILKNALYKVPSGGSIEVTASETAIYTEIRIEDDGGGFAREDLPHIFERFYKGRDSREAGVGIGLAFTRQVITAQDGTIKAANMEKGAEFVIRFYKSIV